MSWWPFGEPCAGAAATVGLGGAGAPLPLPRAGHAVERSVRACASGKLYVLPRPSEAPVYQGSRATFCK